MSFPVSLRFIAAAVAAFALDIALICHPSENAAQTLGVWLMIAFALMLADAACVELDRWRKKFEATEGNLGCLPPAFWLLSVFLLFIAECVAQDKPAHIFFPPQNIFLLALETGLLVFSAGLSRGLYELPPRPLPTPPSPAPRPQPPAPAPSPYPSSDWAERKAAILAHCRAHGGRITTRECMDLLRVNHARTAFLLERLVQEGVLIHVGKRGDKSSHYALAENK